MLPSCSRSALQYCSLQGIGYHVMRLSTNNFEVQNAFPLPSDIASCLEITGGNRVEDR